MYVNVKKRKQIEADHICFRQHAAMYAEIVYTRLSYCDCSNKLPSNHSDILPLVTPAVFSFSGLPLIVMVKKLLLPTWVLQISYLQTKTMPILQRFNLKARVGSTLVPHMLHTEEDFGWICGLYMDSIKVRSPQSINDISVCVLS